MIAVVLREYGDHRGELVRFGAGCPGPFSPGPSPTFALYDDPIGPLWLRYGCSPQPDRVVDSLEFGGITDHSDYQHLVPLYLERQHLIDGPIEWMKPGSPLTVTGLSESRLEKR